MPAIIKEVRDWTIGAAKSQVQGLPGSMSVQEAESKGEGQRSVYLGEDFSTWNTRERAVNRRGKALISEPFRVSVQSRTAILWGT